MRMQYARIGGGRWLADYDQWSCILTVLYVLPILLLCTTVKLFGINIYVYVLTVNETKMSEFVPKSATSKEHIYI